MKISLILSGLVQAVIGLLQFYRNSPLGLFFLGESRVHVGGFNASAVYLPDGYRMRSYGTFPHPNILGGFLVLICFILINWLLTLIQEKTLKKKYLLKVFLSISLLLCITCIVVTWSRTAWLALFAVIFIRMIIFLYKNFSKKIFVGFIIFSLTTIACLGLWVMKSDNYLARALKNRLVEQSSETDISVTERRMLMEKSVEIASSNSVTGVGMGNFVKYLSNIPVYNAQGVRIIQPVHNVFMMIFVENGIIGSAILSIILVLIAIERFKAQKISFINLLIVSAYVLCIFFLDHYFWTLPQGLVMMLIVIPFIVSLKNNDVMLLYED
ncbi:O-antigen ligase family protein [Candidatus Dojkabacteria bacterium]|nr:O-antigen ligase family protein [Candidatus Dojkabacteria bacterium]